MLLKYLWAANCYIQELWVKFMHWTLPFCLCLIVADLKFVRRNNGVIKSVTYRY